MLTGIMKREQARSFADHLLQATLVPDLRGKGNPIGCSASLYSAWRQQRKVTQGFKGHYDILSRSLTQWIKTESGLGALGSGAVILATNHTTSASGGRLFICRLAAIQQFVLLSCCSFHSL